MDVELIFPLVNAVHRTHVYAGSVFYPDARFDDHIGHPAAPE
jgi:hypothetical protein